MAQVVVLGAGISGHTAALFLRKWLGKDHSVVVVSPSANYNWIPSNIWVGVGLLKPHQVMFPLAPIYRRAGIEFKQARAIALHPEGSDANPSTHVDIEWTLQEKAGEKERVAYDFLINATGPKLNFGATEGLGPEEQPFGMRAGARRRNSRGPARID